MLGSQPRLQGCRAQRPCTPMTIQGLRMPILADVRSLILPKNGFPTRASSAPIPVTNAKLVELIDPHQRIDLQRQRDQQRCDQHQAGAHVRQRVQRDETPPDARQ